MMRGPDYVITIGIKIEWSTSGLQSGVKNVLACEKCYNYRTVMNSIQLYAQCGLYACERAREVFRPPHNSLRHGITINWLQLVSENPVTTSMLLLKRQSC